MQTHSLSLGLTSGASRRAIRVMRSELPLRTRFRVLAVGLRRHLLTHPPSPVLRRVFGAPSGDIPLDLGDSTAFLSVDTWKIDYEVFIDTFIEDVFRSLPEGRVILDLGAHRGYFSAYSLLHGARSVYAFEPHPGNHATLVKTLRSFDPHRYRWHSEQCAVGPTDGEVLLHLSSESWSHSIYKPASGDVVGFQRVRMRAFSSILEYVLDLHPGEDVAVKVNIEGAAGAVILGTPVDLWGGVTEVMMDYERNTPERLPDVLDHLRHAGLSPPERGHPRFTTSVREPWIRLTR